MAYDFKRKGDQNMLEVLERVEKTLPGLLDDRKLDDWNSVLIDYHPPVVKRLWRNFEDEYRIYLHEILPCQPGEALLHPHPWPSAMRVVSGTYEMGIGYGSGSVEPPVAATVILSAKSTYEMVDKDAWHYVRPLRHPALSLMVTGKPWHRESPGTGKQFKTLTSQEKERILGGFVHHYIALGI